MKNIAILYPIDTENKKSGGVETCIKDFIKYAPASWNIKIIGITTGPKTPLGQWRELDFQDRRVQFFPVLLETCPNKRAIIPLILRFTFALFRYRKYLLLGQYDLHFHRIEPCFVAKSYGLKKYLFIHGDIRDLAHKNSENKWKALIGVYFFLESFFIRYMTNVFVVSKEGCNFYKNRYPDMADRFKFLPTWYDGGVFKIIPDLNKIEILQSLKIIVDGPVFISVSRLEPQKDPVLLLRVFELIHAKFPNSCLLIIGEGTLRSTLMDVIQKIGLERSVYLLGNKRREDISKLLNVSDVFLLTSAFEGMPIVVHEALSCGTAVVVTKAGDSHLVIREGINGAVVNSRDPNEIAQKALIILENKLNRAEVSASIQDYSVNKALDDLYAVI